MKSFSDLSVEELNKMDKRVLITIIVALQSQLNSISSQLDFLTEQIALMNQRSFGKKTEQLDQLDQFQQLTVFDFFNEPEALSDESPEPEITEVIISSHTRRKKTKREDQLEGLPARIFEHTIEKEELSQLFPEGYKELPVETYKRVSIIPQTIMVDEHHVHVYASKNNDGTIVRADRPVDLFRNSVATPSLVASIMTGKYQNHLPLERQIQVFKANGIKLESNTLANWMILASDKYLSKIFSELVKQLKALSIIHADETPFRVIGKPPIDDDGKSLASKSYMWVYRNADCNPDKPIIIYDYRRGRDTNRVKEFLKGFSGILITDGYQVYHTLEKSTDGLKIAGCWVHAKRKFAELIKATAKGDVRPDYTIAAEATKRISEIFHLDGRLKDLSKSDREKERQRIVKPKVDDFFEWAKAALPKVPADGATHKGLNYCINQEAYLRVFLTNGDIPMDNNSAERAIRPFTLGRKNWVNMFSEKGADSSAVIYSLVETAKANNLRVYNYLELLLEEIPKHSEEETDYLQDLMPWSDYVQEKCHTLKKPQTVDQYYIP